MQRRLMSMGEREGLPRAPVHGREVRVQFRLLSRAGKRSRKPLNYGWEIDESAGRTTGGSNSLDCRAGRVRRRARVAIVDEWSSGCTLAQRRQKIKILTTRGRVLARSTQKRRPGQAWRAHDDCDSLGGHAEGFGA